MPELMLLLAVIAGVAVVIFGVWAFQRHQYIQSLKERGWQFVDRPDISVAFGLNHPPFGSGFQRRVDDQIVGRAGDGTHFSAFKYETSEWRSPGYIVRMPLGRSLQPAQLASPDGGAPITVDHDSIVLTGSPEGADELAASIETLASVRSSFLSSAAGQLEGPPAPEGLSFVGRPHWTYIARDDSYLDYVDATLGGFNHEAHDIIVSPNSRIPFVRLTHRWQTRSTRTDSEGRTHTTTHNHRETLCQFRTTFPFPALSVNWGIVGAWQRFEWEEFNSRFKVRCGDSKFASDVMHQQQMEYLMRANPPGFLIESNGVVRIGEGADWTVDEIDWASSFLFGFFGHVPNFVWQQLGAWPRPVPQLEA